MTSAAWLASFAVQLIMSGSLASSTAADMREFWKPIFMPSPLHARTWINWMLTWGLKAFDFVEPFGVPVTRSVWFLALLLSTLGIASIWSRRWMVGILLAPLAAALAASTLQLYPFAQRFLFFFNPALNILIAAGITTLRGPSSPTLLAPVLAAVLVIGTRLDESLRDLTLGPPFAHEDTRPVWEDMVRRVQPNDAIYVSFTARASLEFYAPSLKDPAHVLIVGSPASADWRFLADASVIRQHHRVWLFFSHLRPDLVGAREDQLLLQVLGQPGKMPAMQAAGVVAYLVEFPERSAN